jgi:hypothetical protein
MSSSSTLERNDALAAEISAAVQQLDFDTDVSDAAIRAIAAAAVKLYSYKVQREGGFPIVEAGAITPTDAMIACTALLRGVNVQVFELGCWQGWMG